MFTQNYYIDFFIDAFQGGKKQVVGAFIKNEGIRDALYGFIDAQTAYTKQAVNATMTAGSKLVDEGKKALQDLPKFGQCLNQKTK